MPKKLPGDVGSPDWQNLLQRTLQNLRDQSDPQMTKTR